MTVGTLLVHSTEEFYYCHHRIFMHCMSPFYVAGSKHATSASHTLTPCHESSVKAATVREGWQQTIRVQCQTPLEFNCFLQPDWTCRLSSFIHTPNQLHRSNHNHHVHPYSLFSPRDVSADKPSYISRPDCNKKYNHCTDTCISILIRPYSYNGSKTQANITGLQITPMKNV